MKTIDPAKERESILSELRNKYGKVDHLKSDDYNILRRIEKLLQLADFEKNEKKVYKMLITALKKRSETWDTIIDSLSLVDPDY